MDSPRDEPGPGVSRRPLPIPPSDRGGRRDERAARAVLTAAVDLLDRRGYRELTMAAVAARAGVSRATLYRWWPSKAHLVLDAYRAKSARDLPAALTGDLRRDLVTHIGGLAHFLREGGSAATIAEITLAAATDAEFGALYRRTLLAERRAALEDVLRAGGAGPRRCEIALDLVLGALHHRLLVSGAPIDGPFVGALADALVAAAGR